MHGIPENSAMPFHLGLVWVESCGEGFILLVVWPCCWGNVHQDRRLLGHWDGSTCQNRHLLGHWAVAGAQISASWASQRMKPDADAMQYISM